MYQFAILDPRSIPAATEANDRLFTRPVYGVEVTVPALAKRCTFNLDPQHTGGDANRAAIEDALTAELPSEGSTLATVRADLDAVGSMAVLDLRAQGESLKSAMDRINTIATADKFARGGYSGPKPLPTRSNPWDESSATAESSRPLAAMTAAVADHKIPLSKRVEWMKVWLESGKEPGITERFGVECDSDVDCLVTSSGSLESYRGQVERERMEMVDALESGAIKYETRFDGRVAVVESTHRAATSVGYSLAPVVVALNPSFKQGQSEPHRKFTICAFEAKFADIKSALAELTTLEAGWGGSPTIGGSPQGVSSKLTIDQVVEVVARHLK